MTLTIDSDYVVIDNTSSITYFSKVANNDWGSGATVHNVLRCTTEKEAIEGSRREGFKNIGKAMRTFHIWNNQISVTPKINDRILDDDGTTWVVQLVELQSLNTRYKLTCDLTRD